MTFTEVQVCAHFEAAVEETGGAALAVAVVGKEAVAHLAVAPHLGATDLGTDEAVADALIFGELSPGCSLLDYDVVVVAEAVALAHSPSGVVQVILHTGVAASVSADGVVIDIVEVVGSHHVRDSLIVLTRVRGQLHTHQELRLRIDVPVEGGTEVQGELVAVALEHVVSSIAAHGVHLLIGVVELVPLNLPVLFGCRPEVIAVLPGCEVVVAAVGQAPYIVVVAGEGLPVVGFGIQGVVVLQARTAVHAVLAIEGGHELQVVVDLEVPGEQGRRLEGVHHARVAFLAILIAPVGVVLVVVGEPVSLIGADALLSALRGRSPGAEAEAVAVVEHLLQGEEIAQ